MAGSTWQTIAVSTHFDDAALSVSGFLVRRPAGAVIVTVHGGEPGPGEAVSSWDRECGFGLAAEAAVLRRQEDAVACAILGVDQVTLSYPDNPYSDGAEPLGELTAFLTESAGQNSHVLVPAGFGNDSHRWVTEQALEALAGIKGAAVSLYFDLPYSAGIPQWSADIEQLLAPGWMEEVLGDLPRGYRQGMPDVISLDEIQWRLKRAAVLAHASQLAPLGQGHGLFLSYPGCLQREVLVPLVR